MKSFLRIATFTLATAGSLFVCAPDVGAASAPAPAAAAAAAGEWNFKFTGGSSTTTTIGGITVTIRTINCSATGNDCKYVGGEFIPKG